MTDGPAVGRRVRVDVPDARGHLRAPRYCRGRTGVVVASHGVHALPSSVVRGDVPVVRERVFAVRFTAAELFGDGDHTVVVDLFESYLEPL